MRLTRFVPVVLIAALLALPAETAAWVQAPHARARLIAGGPVEAEALAGRMYLPAPALIAGLEIRLDPGWHTYWRTPGDGIAPQFDWSGSQNVAATQVLWPAPDHFRDAAGEYNGYADRVVLPVVVAPARPGAPVKLALGLEFAICKDICIPVSTRLSLSFSSNDFGQRDTVLGALRRTPLRADGQGRCGALKFEDIRARLNDSPPRLEVTIAHPRGAAPEDLFVEAETGQFMPHPERIQSGAERTVFHLDPSAGGDPHGLAGQTLTLTAVAAPRSCAMAWTVE